MKSNIGLAAVQAMLLGATDFAAKHPGIASGNRRHTDQAKPGSIEETKRLCLAQLKRERKNAKRLRDGSVAQREVAK
jgi:hypothetical protein